MVELVPDSSLGRVPEHYEGLCSPILAEYISRPPGFVRALYAQPSIRLQTRHNPW